ncbi:hypothetical protein KY290_027817 [Solanum tuberosum]|uniref:Uncharacterized protein n=1 Tax=Solanum tuberosum TaxID=4113 RepID=A0ABQ7UJD7_SOLTU|nr:hypothetical protein KY285_026793 [Solanum tuberosum]KAH0748585.1 hypothetical protein KY290_027817 [Solanum tuberosum]
MKDAWNELDLIAPAPGCDCEESTEYVNHLCNQRLLQILMGLNETFSHVRSDILLKMIVLTVNQAYAMVVHEESQRVLGVTNSNRDFSESISRTRSRLQA